MNIKTKLSVEFSFTIFGILMFFSVLVYYFSYSSHLSKFRDDLLIEAQNTAILLLNVEEVDSTLLKKIHITTKSLDSEEIALTDSTNTIIYSYKIDLLTSEFVNRVSSPSDQFYFSIGTKDGVSYKHVFNKQNYHVFVLAEDRDRTENLKRLRKVLLWSILFGFWLSISTSYLFSKLAIKPISNIISKVKDINRYKLSNRLDEGKGQDEFELLAITFNKMLSDLEQVFKSQDEFISNASHELRTPLAVMMAELDYLRSKERTVAEYQQQLDKLTNDLRNLNHLLNSLLELAHINRDKTIQLSKVRIDEIIFNALQTIKTKYPLRKIIPRIEYSDNEDDLIIMGNAGLLEIAIKNLMDNACKFSTAGVDVNLEIKQNDLLLHITDYGIGIPANEQDSILKAFSRGTNVRYIGGFGVGLSIVSRILDLHSAGLKFDSVENKTTVVTVAFKKMNNQTT